MVGNNVFELMRHDLKCRILHKRVAAIAFQTAMPSIPVVNTAKGNIYIYIPRRSKVLLGLNLRK